MGFFSWKLADEPEQTIWNKHSEEGATPCKMIMPDGTEYPEPDYDGYGDFGGHDFYSEVSLLNGGDGSRDHGIDIMEVNTHDYPPAGIIAPKLVSMDCTILYRNLPYSPTCQSQGFFPR